MMPLMLVDAFTDEPFRGNPAAVCILDHETTTEWMQSMASEMNQAETAFVSAQENGFGLRWFTPVCEVDLCGHATLASAHVLWTLQYVRSEQPIHLHTRSGTLIARRLADNQILLDFPLEVAYPQQPPERFAEALGLTRPPIAVYKNRMDWLVHVDGAEELRQLRPDMDALAKIPGRGWIVTCASDLEEYDFLSRFFGPAVGIPEDPVTGSAHCCLVAYWSDIRGKKRLVGYQASQRGGKVTVEMQGDRALMSGHAVTVVHGHCVRPPFLPHPVETSG
jgi:PhzF family phenazine biosynthesis protein